MPSGSRLFFVLLVFLALAPFAFAVIQHGSMSIYAVTSSDQALEARLDITIRPGSGKIWSSVGPLVGTSTQHTERISVEIAKNYFKDVDKYDYLFDINSNASVVEGPSAGAAMSLLLISMLEDHNLPAYVGITGQIMEDGSIGAVGGVFEKAKKASETGKKLFMIPKGEAYQMHRFPDGVKTVNLVEYGYSEWGMKVVEVSNIDEALKLAFVNPATIDVNTKPSKKPSAFVPPQIEITPALEPMKSLTSRYLKEARQAINDAKTALNKSPIEEPEILSALLESLRGSEQLLEEAKLLQEKNYLYSSANYSFLAIVEARLVKDLSENPSLIESDSTLLEMKASQLGKQISLFEKDLNSFYSVKMLEWVIAAKQRLLWAKLKVTGILTTKTIVISSSGRAASDVSVAIENLRNYEYARAWLEVSRDFWEIASKADDKIAPVNVFGKKAEEYIIKAENEVALVPSKDAEDIQRRLSAAKLARDHGWNDAALFDSASALALARAESAIKTQDFKEILGMLGSKLSLIQAEFSSSSTGFVWAKLYFDHSKYYFEAARYFAGRGEMSTALENAKSGLRLAFFAEQMLEVKKEAWAEMQNMPVVQPFKEPAPQGSPLQSNWLPVLIIVATAAGAAAVLVWNAISRPGSEEAFISRRMQRLEQMKHQVDRARLKNKISESEHMRLSATYEKQLRELETEKAIRSKHLLEMDKLHGEIEKIQFMLSQLKEQYKAGEIVANDYHEMLDLLEKRLSEVKGKASEEESTVSRENKKISKINKFVSAKSQGKRATAKRTVSRKKKGYAKKAGSKK